MKVLVLPRDPNPYQEQLYREMRAAGTAVGYATGPTGSQTVDLLLLPLTLVAERLRGADVLHVHWVFGFVPQWASSRRWRRVWRAWFAVIVHTARAVGLSVVWTAHNVLPHRPVFDDDAAGRRALVRSCHLIIVHNRAAAAAVRSSFAPACPVEIIPHGNYDAVLETITVDGSVEAMRGLSPGTFVVALVGRIEPYKGAPELLHAVEGWKSDRPIAVVIAGECRDAALRTTIEKLASAAECTVRLLLRPLNDAEFVGVLRAADVVVFPFRAVSTSGSLIMAMGCGAACVVPRLPAFADMPDDAVIFYDPADAVAGLREGLDVASRQTSEQGLSLRAAARRHVVDLGWDVIARRHLALFEKVSS